jgi:hypothetical protein
VNLTIATGASRVEVNLYYQTTSREYMEFLRNEIMGTGNLTLPLVGDPPATPSGETQAYIAQSDPFFDKLKAWGTTMWDLWVHNMNQDGAKPFLMAQATIGDTTACGAPTPTLLSAIPSNQTVTLTWSDESGDPGVVGYSLYYDQADKAQLIDGNLGSTTTTYADTGQQNGIQLCYKVTSRYRPIATSSVPSRTTSRRSVQITVLTPSAGTSPPARARTRSQSSKQPTP